MTAFKSWYAANKEKFNADRAAKRRADPEYAARQKSYKKPVERTPDPKNALVLSDLCVTLGTTVWVVKGWREHGVLPSLHSAKGKLWVHKDNLGLLQKFLEWFEKNRGYKAPEDQFEDMVNWVRANWTNVEN